MVQYGKTLKLLVSKYEERFVLGEGGKYIAGGGDVQRGKSLVDGVRITMSNGAQRL